MRNETSCSIIRDLLPNYAEGLTSPETSAVVKAHLETCHTCRSLYEDYQKPVDIPQSEEIKTDKKLIRKIWYQSMWYLFWPCLYAVFLKAGWEKQALTVFGTFAAVVFTALFTFPAYDIYFDDEKKKEYYSREEKQLKRGNENWFVRNLIWLLPILIPILVEGISQLIVYVKG